MIHGGKIETFEVTGDTAVVTFSDARESTYFASKYSDGLPMPVNDETVPLAIVTIESVTDRDAISAVLATQLACDASRVVEIHTDNIRTNVQLLAELIAAKDLAVESVFEVLDPTDTVSLDHFFCVEYAR